MSPREKSQKAVNFQVSGRQVQVPVSDDLWRLFDEQFAQPARRNSPDTPSAKRKRTLIDLMRVAYLLGAPIPRWRTRWLAAAEHEHLVTKVDRGACGENVLAECRARGNRRDVDAQVGSLEAAFAALAARVVNETELRDAIARIDTACHELSVRERRCVLEQLLKQAPTPAASPPMSSATRPAARRAPWWSRASACASATRSRCTARRQ